MDASTKKYLDGKFAGVDQQFARVDQRFAAVDQQFAKMDGQFAKLADDIAEVGSSVSALASHVDERFDELAPIINQVENHEKRVKFLEDRLPRASTR